MRRLLTYLSFLCCFAGLALSAPRAQAATFTVTNLSDSTTDGTCSAAGTGDGCTLREAITAANADTNTIDTIIFASGLTGTITLSTALPDLSSILSITNAAKTPITLARSSASDTAQFGVLRVATTGNATLQGLTLTNGNAAGIGGGLDNRGTVALTGCTISGNSASNGGGLENYEGVMTLTNCTVAGNNSGFGGGIFTYGNANTTLTNCTITRNSGSGIYIGSNTVTMSNCLVVGNTNADLGGTNATSNGYNVVGTGITSAFTKTGDKSGATVAQVSLGDLADNGGPTPTVALQRGSIAIDAGNTTLATDQRGVARPFGSATDVGAYEFNGTPSLVVTTLADEDNSTSDPTYGAGTSLREAINYANSSLDQSNITFASGLTGTIALTSVLPSLTTNLSITSVRGLITLSATGGRYSVLQIVGANVNLNGLTLTGGKAAYGGGLNIGGGNANSGGGSNIGGNATLDECTISGNSASYGGGIYVADGTLIVRRCSITNNTAGYGAGISLQKIRQSSALTLSDSALSTNSAADYGGGLYNPTGTVSTLNNCSLFGNTATSGGGGLYNDAGTVTLSSCTVANNSTAANRGGGLLVNLNLSRTTLSSSIVANNSTDVDRINNTGNAYTSNGYNLIGTSGTGALVSFTQAGDQTGVTNDQLKLGTPQDNGGPTQTLAIGADSIAFNAGDPSVASSTLYDQRGTPYRRVIAGREDVGAYEFQGPFNESLVVTTLADEDDSTSDPAYGNGTSLREAINLANSNPDQSDITFAAGLTGTLTLTQALPDLSTSLSIQNHATQMITLARAQGASEFTILSANAGSSIPPTTLDLSGLVFQNGGGRSILGGGLVNRGATVTVTNCVFSDNTAANGGGVNNNRGTMTLANCTLKSNSSPVGGALINFGQVTLNNCTISNNTSSSVGGGIAASAGVTALNNCTLTGNTASTNGGAIYVQGNTTLTNCTCTGNAAQYGGGLYNDRGTATLSHCTLSGNTANPGGGLYSDSGTTTLSNSIVAGNGAADVSSNATLTSGGYNLVGTGDTGSFTATGDQTGVTPDQLKLGDLADNGGPTQTRALLPGSIAINAGNPDTTGLPAYDQRGQGFPRISGGRVDVGAYEAQLVAVQGTVYNAVARGGLSGIRVQALTNDKTLAAQTLTDTAGHYTLQLIPGAYTLVATKPDNAALRIAPAFTNPVTFTAAGTGTTSYDFRAIGIGGRVINPNNIGVADVTLTLQGAGDPVTQASDSDGFFSFDGLAAGTYTLTPAGASNLVFTPTSRTLTVADGALFTSFKAVSRITYSLAGNVTSGGQGLEGVTITATRASDGRSFATKTGSDGSYTLPALSEDRYTVTAQADGLIFTYAPIPQQPQQLVLTAQSPTKSGINFTARRTITGTVYNAVALRGIPRVVVKAVRQSDGLTVAVGTDENGRYSLDLEVGTYTLTAFLPNANYPIAPIFTNPVVVPASVPTSNPPYNFRAVGIGGRIISPNNTGISGVTVNLYAPKDAGLKNPLRSVVTDTQGFFSFDGIVPGTWNIVPISPTTYAYTPGSRLIEVQNQAVFTSFRASVKPSTAPRSVESGKRSGVMLSSISADAEAGTLTLRFTGALDKATAEDIRHYGVQVDGEEVRVQAAQLSTNGETLVLSLSEDVLAMGGEVVVSWAGVLDSKGLALRGQTQVNVP